MNYIPNALVSIIVCTYNRSNLLSETLDSLTKQACSLSFEVIVVDNNSTDDTRGVVESKMSEYPTALSYVYEDRQGLSFARNTGINRAQGEIIVFTDDDIEAGAGWLDAIVAAFDSDEVVCAGGPIRPIWPIAKPEWLTENWQVYLGVFEYADAIESQELHGPCYPCGVNIAFRKSIFAEVGMFSPDLGRIGASLLSNEESRVCNLIERLGKRIRFAPQAIIYHKIASSRLTKQWFYHRLYWQGRSDAILDKSLGNDGVNKVVSYLNSLLSSHRACVAADFDSRCTERLLKGYIIQFLSMTTSDNVTDIAKILQRMICSAGNKRMRKTPAQHVINSEPHVSRDIDLQLNSIVLNRLLNLACGIVDEFRKRLNIVCGRFKR